MSAPWIGVGLELAAEAKQGLLLGLSAGIPHDQTVATSFADAAMVLINAVMRHPEWGQAMLSTYRDEVVGERGEFFDLDSDDIVKACPIGRTRS